MRPIRVSRAACNRQNPLEPAAAQNCLASRRIVTLPPTQAILILNVFRFAVVNGAVRAKPHTLGSSRFPLRSV